MRSQILSIVPLSVIAISCAGGEMSSATTFTAGVPNLAGSARGEAGPIDSATLTSTAGRVLIRDARLTFEVGDGDEQKALRTRITDDVKKLGGYVAGEYETSIVVRVPSNGLDGALQSLDTLGKITKKSIYVEEVTAQHTDLTIRIDNARRLRTRLQSLLADAKDVPEMLEVEKELARVTQELELYEGQLRSLDNKVALATVTIDFEPAVRPGPVGWVFYGLYKGVKWLFVWD